MRMSFIRQLLVYGIASTASRLVGVVLVPLYTRALTQAEYGTFEILLALYILLVALSGWQSESALARDYHEADEEGWQRQLIWSAVAISLVGFGLIGLATLVLLLIDAVPHLLLPYVPWLLVLIVPTQLVGLQLIVLRFSHRPLVFALLSIADLIVSAIASIIFIVYGGYGIVGGLAGLLVGKCVVLVLGWGSTFGRFTSPLPLKNIPLRMLQYGAPILIPVLLGWAQKNGSGILLALLLTLADVAIAGVALKIVAVFEIAALSFRQAWDPYAFAQLKDPEAAQPLFRRAMALYVLIMAGAAGILTLIAPLAADIFAPPEYALAGALAGLFIIGQFWIGTVSILGIGIHGSRRISRIAYAFAAGAVLNVLLLVFLSRQFGIVSAGIGSVASGVVTALLAAHFSERTFAIRFDWKTLASAMIATSTFAASVYLVRVAPFTGGLASPFVREAVCVSAFVIMMVILALVGDNRRILGSYLRGGRQTTANGNNDSDARA